ncbi:hypothetical protein M3202_15950 [Alkalihalobacillus oceani]|uniref:Uncharacterized protein n=1 Tax=Halalkalibacter oceani TaxID=1653776 RepID=A0A9X2DRE2_9BACI|nr:hypothetical protein [Halalkalibacter oceani]MCM3715559.1 hypothetical protein [Halalkalibacter oceani]
MAKRTISLTRLTPVQLQQRLIYTQSELAKYKQQVERYQNDYYYGLIDELQQKNEQLIQQNEELNKQVTLLKEERSLREKLQQENDKLMTERQKLEQQLTDHDSLQPLQEKKQQLETEIAEASQQLADLKKERERLTSEEENTVEESDIPVETNADSSPALSVNQEESSWFVRNLSEKKKKR